MQHESPSPPDPALPDALAAALRKLLALPEDQALPLLDELVARYPEHADALRDRMRPRTAATVERAPAPDARSDARSDAPPDDRIGPYRILSEIGSGGMGTVYVAEQREPLPRRVALKVIKLGLDSREVLRRFDIERDALARMNHPNVARVLDAGVTDRGRPYFAMEYVEGLPLVDYCDKHRLDVRARIDLFRGVCAGVQHAHQKGVIHRDLKPGNVLVARDGDRAVPKIIDFGLARAIDRSTVAQSVFTEHGRLIGTPEYMSPEQATLDGEGLDTRTDVYSLGVMLYELLTGSLPVPSSELRRMGLVEVQRVIRDVDPPKPSSKVESSARSASEWADRRLTTETGLARLLRGDLDWIVMRAMAKEPSRRYATPDALSEDLQRHLDLQPVHAGPPSRTYKVRKWLRRYRVQAAAAAAVLVALVVGATVSIWQADRARAAERVARSRADELRIEKAQSDAVLEFILTDMLEAVSPERLGRDVRVADLIDRARDGLDARFEDQPEVAAGVRLALGRIYTSLGLFDEAGELVARAVADHESLFGVEHDRSLRARFADAQVRAGRGRSREAVHALHRLMEKAAARTGEGSPFVLDVRRFLAEVLAAAGDLDEAVSIARDVARRREALDPGDAELLEDQRVLASILDLGGTPKAAEAILLEVLGRLERGDAGLAAVVRTKRALGSVYRSRADWEGAERIAREVVDASREIYGPDHAEYADALAELALVVRDRGVPDRAVPLQENALRIYTERLPPDHRLIRLATNNLGNMLARSGQLERAIPMLERNRERCLEHLPPDHQDVALAYEGLAFAYRLRGQEGDRERALEWMEKAIPIYRGVFGPGSARLADPLANLADTHLAMGRYAEAAARYEELYEIDRRHLDPDSEYLLADLSNLGNALVRSDRLDEAWGFLQEAMRLPAYAARSKWAPTVDRWIGEIYLRRGEFAAAEPLFRRARDHCEQSGKHSWGPESLAALYRAWGKDDLADEFEAEAAAWREARAGPADGTRQRR